MTKKCKSCMKDIDQRAKKCPHCQADQRGWFRRHPILTGILGIILFFVVIGIISSGGSKNSSSSGNGDSSSNTTPSVQSAKVGSTVNDGDLAFTVQSVDNSQTIGGAYTQKTAQGTYYILTVKIQNNGKDTKTINASD